MYPFDGAVFSGNIRFSLTVVEDLVAKRQGDIELRKKRVICEKICYDKRMFYKFQQKNGE